MFWGSLENSPDDNSFRRSTLDVVSPHSSSASKIIITGPSNLSAAFFRGSSRRCSN